MKRTEKTPIDQHQKLEENDGDEEDTGGGLATFVQAAAAAQGGAAPPGVDTTTPFTLAKQTTAPTDIEQIEAVPRVNVNSTIIVPGAVHVRGFGHTSSSEEDSSEGEEIQGATTRGGAHGRSESQLLAEETSLPRRTATPMLVAHLVDDDDELRGRRNAASQQVPIPMAVAEELQTTSNKWLYWILLLFCFMLVAAAIALGVTAPGNDDSPVDQVVEPSDPQSDGPDMPVATNSPTPALVPPSFAVQSFRQDFLIPQERLFNKPEHMFISTLFASYTDKYSDAEETQRITTTCEFTDQNMFACELGCIFGQPNDGFVLVADYFCNWTSLDYPVIDLPEKYTNYMNQNRSGVLYDMQSSDLDVTEVGFVRRSTEITAGPAPSPRPTRAPTTFPPTTAMPTPQPSRSFSPTISDEPSPVPTKAPTSNPTSTPRPSDMPSATPTQTEAYIVQQLFRQQFLIPEEQFFNETEQVVISFLFASYTPRYANPDEASRIATFCEFVSQNTFACELGCPFQNSTTGEPQGDFYLEADYFCNWTSTIFPVDGLPEDFISYMNTNLTGILDDMQQLLLNITDVGFVRPNNQITPAPTISKQPTLAPTHFPTLSAMPSLRPSIGPSPEPSPVLDISFSPGVRFPPTPFPTVSAPKGAPTYYTGAEPRLSTSAVLAIVIVLGVAILMAMILFYHCQRKKRRQEV